MVIVVGRDRRVIVDAASMPALARFCSFWSGV